jgi:hypothetical protein
MSVWFVEARGGLPRPTTPFVIETIYELILFGLVPLLVTLATVWILWYVLEKIDPDEVTEIPSFLTFIIVAVPFVILNYGGLTILIYNEMTVESGGSHPVLLPLAPQVIVVGAVVYIGLAVWLWSHWRKLRIHQREIQR